MAGAATPREDGGGGDLAVPARRVLGRTGLTVSELGIGTAWILGHDHDRTLDEGVATIRRALHLGIDLVDTAECYVGGRAELVVGAALAGSDGAVLSTKFGHVPGAFGWTAADVVASAATSLERLGRARVDVLFLHAPPEPPIDALTRAGGALDGMREVRERGWCRSLGVTGNEPEFLRRCIATDAFDVVLLFDCFDLLEQHGRPAVDEALAHDMGVIIGGPLRAGALTPRRVETIRWRQRFTKDQRARVDELERLFSDRPGGLVAAATRFPLDAVPSAAVLVGVTEPREVDEMVAAAASPRLPTDLLERAAVMGASR